MDIEKLNEYLFRTINDDGISYNKKIKTGMKLKEVINILGDYDSIYINILLYINILTRAQGVCIRKTGKTPAFL